MNNEPKSEYQPNVIYNVVMAVVLAMSVGLTSWTATKVIYLGEIVSSQQVEIVQNSSRLDILEKFGSRTLESHISSDDSRVADIKVRLDKLESAVLALQSTPGELKAINVQLSALKEGQMRIEKTLHGDSAFIFLKDQTQQN